MIMIVDCNYFYAACHEMWDATLWDKAVVSYSNNNGVVVSLNTLAKKQGIHRGMVRHLNKEHLDNNPMVKGFASNYTLYDSMSDRVMRTLQHFVEDMEIYSIDEAFLSLKGYEHLGLESYGRTIANTVKKNTGIAVSAGIAETKTLCKIANRFSKKYARFNNVFMIDTEIKRIECLKRTNIKDVWGIGEKISDRLWAMGINTAYDFTTLLTRKQVKKEFTIEGERTWLELQGISCYPVEPSSPQKKSISTTRSFDRAISDLNGLREAVSTYAVLCGADLRRQKSYAVSITVLLETNRFDSSVRYNPQVNITLPVPSNTSNSLIKYAMLALDQIYVPNIKYKRAGVIVTKITDVVQTNVFHDNSLDYKFSKVSKVEDYYCRGFDRRLLSFAVMGYGNRRKEIELNSEMSSPRPTTHFKEILQIDCT